MSDGVVRKTEMETSEKELHRLIIWTKENPDDWRRICDPDSYNPDIEYIVGLVNRLYKDNLLTLIYVVLHTNDHVVSIDWVINRTINECLLDTSIEVLVERFRKNLEIKAREKVQNEQKEQPQG